MGCYYYNGRYYGPDDVPDSTPYDEEERERDYELYEEVCEDRFESQREKYYETWN